MMSMKRMSRLLSVLLGAVLVAGTILLAGGQTAGGGTTEHEREVCLGGVDSGSRVGYDCHALNRPAGAVR